MDDAAAADELGNSDDEALRTDDPSAEERRGRPEDKKLEGAAAVEVYGGSKDERLKET